MSEMNRKWVLTARPKGDNFSEILEWREEPVPTPGPGEALIRNIYISMDPAMRIWMTEVESYYPPVPLGDAMHAMTIGVVEASNNPDLKVGDIVSGIGRWSEYYVVSTLDMGAVMPWDGVTPLSTFVGTLGPTGLTAYFGLMDVGRPKAGETVVVSAAAGAVGSMVGQIAKIQGCRVVGIAGSDEKCAWLTEHAGFDAAINYKTEDVGAALDTHCPNGIDINFENVGGTIMDAVIARLNDFSRMPLCGLISTYNDTEPTPGPYNFANLLMRRTLVKGFIVIDYYDRFPEGAQAMAGWLMEGKLIFETDIVDGLENAPKSLERLFTGKNLGKLVVRVSPEPET